MAIQTPLSQEQLIAQALGAAAVGGGGLPGQGGLPAPSGLPGTPMMSPQMTAAGGVPPVNPMQVASSADVLAGEGSMADFLAKSRDWRACMAMGRRDCGPQPQRGNPLPPPTLSTPPAIGGPGPTGTPPGGSPYYGI